MSYPFQVKMRHNEGEGTFDLLLLIGDFKSKEVADKFAEALAEWMVANGGNGEYWRHH